MLISVSGRPGTGKTTIARRLSGDLGAVYLNLDSIEQSMRQDGWPVDGEGYTVAQAIAEDNLRLGRVVVSDSINPSPSTRAGWRAAAQRVGLPVLDVEIVCSDEREYRRRVERGFRESTTQRRLTWVEASDFDYRPWDSDALVVDTARLTTEESIRAILAGCSGTSVSSPCSVSSTQSLLGQPTTRLQSCDG